MRFATLFAVPALAILAMLAGAPARAPMTYQEFVATPQAQQRYWARSHLGWQRMGRAEPNAAFERVLDLAAAVCAPYLVAASATVAEPARHTARVFDLSDPGRVAHVGVGRSVSTGWVHHLFLRQRPEVSSMSAVTNATACLIHNRRDGLFNKELLMQVSGAGKGTAARFDFVIDLPT